MTQSDRPEAEVLLREYDNLATDSRTLMSGQYTLGMIGVLLPLGLLTAALELGRGEVVLAVPAAFVLVACGIGVQQSMMAYIGRHLSVLEDRINRLCGGDQSPLLTWYGRRSFVHLGHLWVNPMVRWLIAIMVVVGLIYIGLVVASGVIAFDVAPGAQEWRYVQAVFYGLAHVPLVGYVGWMFRRGFWLTQEAYDKLEGSS